MINNSDDKVEHNDQHKDDLDKVGKPDKFDVDIKQGRFGHMVELFVVLKTKLTN